ncbi:protein kinase domain-containing protein [Caldimonas sp. KR1-144]|uniref:protein kinase domain-containing protein n=1 Tax=Caldimonas sp. KR1-144 TaxID=3400911 RepID=UPI003C0F0685
MASEPALEPAPQDYPARVLAPGQVVDQFRIEEHLHQGGMAQVWRVSRLDRPDDPMPLVMKVPRIMGGEDPASIVGFEVEQMIMPLLKGLHVPAFVARGDFTQAPYIVMERIDGPSLRPRLDAAPLPVAEVVDIGIRVATALHDLHRQHLVHLDVKPSNIMFRRQPDGTLAEAVLVDFGLSRHDQLPDLLDEEFTLPMGTGPYISPEQVQFVRNDPRSDLFALGVMLYHLLTGERPFGHPTSVSGLRRRLYEEPEPPRALRPDCPPWLQELILRCLEVRAERRHPSAAQLALDLQHPQQVALTERAQRVRTSGTWATLRRRFAAVGAEPAGTRGAAEQAQRNPIVVAALDVENAPAALLDMLRDTVRRFLHDGGSTRLACVSVMKTARIGMDELTDAQGRSRHVKQLVALKHWARPLARELGLGDGRLTFHVLEAPDAAEAIVEFAQRNQVDHVIMGARGASALRRYLGSVSSQVVAQSSCTVTVVRAPAE